MIQRFFVLSLAKPMRSLKTLGNMPVADFLQHYWHQKPLLVRNFINTNDPYWPLCDMATLRAMARDPDIETRLIQQHPWRVQHGPLDKLPNVKTPAWTVLLQDTNHHLPEAHALMSQFRFIPDARLDDVMVSFASDQGGVGPHYDSYDVFLIQMHGQRQWRIGPLHNPTLLPDCPLKILEHFEPNEIFVLNPGDMLYLPPNYGHEGIALGPCSTVSIGFRAPKAVEVYAELLREWADTLESQMADNTNLQYNMFVDGARSPVTDPAEVPDELLAFAQNTWSRFAPSQHDLTRAFGKWLTSPKPHVYFENNNDNLSPKEIKTALCQHGIALSLKTQMLFKNSEFYINGECIHPNSATCIANLKRLANDQEMSAEKTVLAFSDEEFQFFLIGFAKAGWIGTLS